MKTKDELIKIYAELNNSEKFGIKFGMFPTKLMDLTHEEIVILIEIAKDEKV